MSAWSTSALIYTVCNLAPGCTEADVINVFGDGYDKFMYNFGEDRGEVIYSHPTMGRTWEFLRDVPGGVITGIQINTEFGYRG